MTFRLSSPVFHERAGIPSEYTCDGKNVSPPLTWMDVPANTKSLALIVDDPDAPKGLWTHWIVYNLDPKMNELPENFDIGSGNARQGINSDENTRYDGPCPSAPQTHTYHFRLFALDQMLDLPSNAGRAEVLAAIETHIVDSAEFAATYARQPARAGR